MSLSAERLLDLPPPLLATILSELHTHPRHETTTHLSSERSVSWPLPADLLAVARSTPALAAAVADVLGGGALMLSGQTARPLHAWVAALTPFVKAVFVRTWFTGRGSGYSVGKSALPVVLKNAISVFRDLSKELVRVEVLDVSDLDLAERDGAVKERFTHSLIAALERSRESLREIGLPATPIFSKAVEKLCFPNLQVVEISQKLVNKDESPSTGDPEGSEEALLMMLRALDGHADRAAKKSTIREIRLLRVHTVPNSTSLESCAGLFSAVRFLKVTFEGSRIWKNGVGGAVVRLVAQFPNLECLRWDSGIKPHHFRVIHDACKNLKEVHLWYIEDFQEHVSGVDLGELFSTCGNKLRTLETSKRLSREELRVLGETNPGLETLGAILGRHNVDALPMLLGTHCRKLRSLTLRFSTREWEFLCADGWHALTEAVRSASEELCELRIKSDKYTPIQETDVDVLERSFHGIVESLGERIRRLVFRVPVTLRDKKAFFELLCRLMQTCGEHARGLEHLDLSIDYAFSSNRFDDVEDERETFTQLLARKQEMMAALPRLETYGFGFVSGYVQRRLAEIDRENGHEAAPVHKRMSCPTDGA